MKKLTKILIVLVLLFTAMPTLAQEKIGLYFFYGEGCPHCAKEEVFLNQLMSKNSDLEIHRYETWNNRDNADLMLRVAKSLNINVTGVPLLIVGNKSVIGYYDAETSGKKIEDIIENYALYGNKDVVAPLIINGENNSSTVNINREKVEIPEKIKVPVLGDIKVKNISLPLLTFIIAALDGLNPCAMWVLLLLVNLLMGMKDRKRMIILGTAFISTSGVLYYLFLAAWLNLLMFLGFVFWIRFIIGIIALASGSYHIKDWWDNRDGGCTVMDIEKRRKVSTKVKEIIAAQSFWLSLVGIIVLAAAINLVELVCSAGLPAIYTQVLILSNLPAWQHYAYLLLYVLVFMLDSVIVFVVAIKSFELKATDSLFARYSILIGGIIMVLLGLLLVFKPGWLMFG